ncbi:MAG: GGDEF domain-containing protein [Lachnospiraceae bacterium]|nr:GGDEF domain-containing protein [Lachnospiraceae bacterium]
MEQFNKYLISVDKDLNVISCESAFLKYIGRAKIGNLDMVVPPQDMIQLRNAVFAINPGELGLSCFRIRTSFGKLNWIAANVEKSDGQDESIHMELSDIQSMKADGALAQYDEMTGLLNKQAITDFARGLTAQYPRKPFYFCLMDIDHFKTVNDTFGHMCGDEVIIDVAHIIRDSVAADGLVGRIGGDEFMLVLEKVDKKPRAREVLAKIREAVEAKYQNFRDSISITVSIGAAFYPDYASDYDELFNLADKMLYLAKTKGRNRYIIYTPEVHGDVNAEIKVAAVSHHAAAENDKVHLMLDYMERFLHKPDVPIQAAIEAVLSAYDLDELHIFFDGMKESKYGVVRTELAKDNYSINLKRISMPILETEEFQRLFDKNNVAVISVYDLNKENEGNVQRYMEVEKYRYMVVYRMAQAKQKGYIVYLNHWESACRLSEADIGDLTYFGRMVELTSRDR